MKKYTSIVLHWHRVLLVLFCLLLIPFLVKSSMAAGAFSGSVSYQGTGEQINVIVSKYPGGAGTLSSVSVGSDGSYSIGGLSEDICYAKTWTNAQQSYLVVQYYNLREHPNDSDDIELIDGEIIPGINFQLEYGGGFSGSVQNSTGPVQNVSITLHKEQCNNSQTVTTFSNSAGEFHIKGVPVGNYYMKLTSGGVRWWLSEDGSAFKDCLLSSPIVNITPQVTSLGFDVVLDLGSLSGTITDINSSSPLHDIAVWLKPQACSSDGAILASSGQDGKFLFANVEAGTYYLMAAGGERRYWQESSSQGTLSCSLASAITVEDGVVTEHIDMSILPPGSIEGTVTDSEGSPLYEMVQIEFYSDPCDKRTSMGTAYRHEDGYYRKDGLPAGDVYLYANSWGAESSKWWHGSGSPIEQCGDAVPVTVVSGQVVSNIDFTLSDSGYASISGQVTDSSGAPLTSIWVYTYGEICDGYISADITDSNGFYQIDDLLPGSKYVMAVDSTNTQQWWTGLDGGTPWCNWAGEVQVNADVVSGNIDFRFLERGGIAGSVSLEDGTPVVDLSISVYRNACESESLVARSRSDDNGEFSFGNLPAGELFLVNDAMDYLASWWQNGLDCDGAEPVTVSADQITSNVHLTVWRKGNGFGPDTLRINKDGLYDGSVSGAVSYSWQVTENCSLVSAADQEMVTILGTDIGLCRVTREYCNDQQECEMDSQTITVNQRISLLPVLYLLLFK